MYKSAFNGMSATLVSKTMDRLCIRMPIAVDPSRKLGHITELFLSQWLLNSS